MDIGSLQNDPLWSQLRELYGRMVYTHKTQEKEADLARARLQLWQNIQLVLSSLTTTGVLASVYGECLCVNILTAIISAVLFGISAYLKNSDFGGLARRHAEAAAFLWDARESYLTMLVDFQSGIVARDIICKRREELQKRLADFFKSAPRTTADAYNKASKALKDCEEFTFTDTEIDKFLPDGMRKR